MTQNLTKLRLFGLALLLLFLSACVICPPRHEADALEPNDRVETATPLELGISQEANLNMGDKDIFKFEAQADERFELSVSTLELHSFPADYFLTITGPDGYEQSYGEVERFRYRSPWYYEPLVFNLPKAGTYYLELSEYLYGSDFDIACTFPVRGSIYEIMLERLE